MTNSSEKASLRSYLHLHFLVLIWGFTAILGLLTSVAPMALVFYRTSLAFVGLGVLLLLRKASVRVPGKDIAVMVFVGVLLSLHWALFFGSARISTASVCLAGISTTSLWTSFIEPLSHNRRINLKEVALGMVAIVGLYLVFRFEFNHAYGLVLAIASALLAALFTVTNSHLVRKHNASVITFYEMAGAAVASLLFSVVFQNANWNQGSFWPENRLDWLWILLLAWLCTVYAYTMATRLMKQFSAYLINLTINLEPVYGITLAFLIFGEKEKMTPGFYAGTFVILMAVLAYPLLMAGRKKS